VRADLEYASILVAPDADAAAAYGDRHLDRAAPEAYDLKIAEEFYQRALALDPTQKYANHQLARIAFLRNELPLALARIDWQIERHGEEIPSSYYVRGLIEGYMENYEASAKDYAIYVVHDPTNWAATNDLAWVLLKANKPKDALVVIDKVLPTWPENPWLLNSKATALYEMGRYEEARAAAVAAARNVVNVTPDEWSRAYPGNDPLIATKGVADFQKAVLENMHTITLALQARQKDVR